MRLKLCDFNGRILPIKKLQQGVTLIELILSILIISIALTGVFSVMNVTIRHSADPLVQRQAIAIAESYLEEILLQLYKNPVGGYVGMDRSQFDDVSDYAGLTDSGVHNNQGNAVTVLADYNVSVSISSPVKLTGDVLAKKITVKVKGKSVDIKLVGYRIKI